MLLLLFFTSLVCFLCRRTKNKTTKRRLPTYTRQFYLFSLICACMLIQLCLTLWDSMDCRLTGSSVHGIFRARILEWVAISSPRGSSWPRDQTWVSCVSCISRWILYLWATREGLPQQRKFEPYEMSIFHYFWPVTQRAVSTSWSSGTRIFNGLRRDQSPERQFHY